MPAVAKTDPTRMPKAMDGESKLARRAVELTGTEPETRYQTRPPSLVRAVLEMFRLGLRIRQNRRPYNP